MVGQLGWNINPKLRQHRYIRTCVLKYMEWHLEEPNNVGDLLPSSLTGREEKCQEMNRKRNCLEDEWKLQKESWTMKVCEKRGMAWKAEWRDGEKSAVGGRDWWEEHQAWLWRLVDTILTSRHHDDAALQTVVSTGAEHRWHQRKHYLSLLADWMCCRRDGQRLGWWQKPEWEDWQIVVGI